MCMGDEEVEFAVLEDGHEGKDEDSAISRQKKFLFTKNVKLLHTQIVRQYYAHISPHEKNEDCFSKVRETFVSNFPGILWRKMQKPSVKTVSDKFRWMLAKRQQINRLNLNSLVMSERIGPCN